MNEYLGFYVLAFVCGMFVGGGIGVAAFMWGATQILKK